MRRTIALLVAVLISGWAVAEEPLKRLTLEALFKDDALALEEMSGLHWLPDDEHFIYFLSRGDQKTLWKENAVTGERLEVADWTAVMQRLGERRPDYEKPKIGSVNSAASNRLAPVLSPDGRSLVGSVSGDLFLLNVATGAIRFLTDSPEPEIFPSFSPDSIRLAFVRSGDLFWLDLASGIVHRATNRGTDNLLLNGVADWVYEEELGAGRSHWWSPDGTSLAFLQFDTSLVTTAPITGDSFLYPELEVQRYPKAGTTNSKVRLGVVDLEGGDPIWMDTGEKDAYLARAGWTPAGEVWAQRLNRDQNILDLVVANPETGTSRVLVTDEDPAWINIRDDLFFLTDGRFLWTSERDGWRHLYLYSADGTLLSRVTEGEWQIETLHGLDGEETTAIFQANREDHRQRHIYRVNLESGEIKRLGANERGAHAGHVAPGADAIIDMWSTRETPPRADLLDADGGFVRRIWESGSELESWDLLPVEAGSITADDGTELYSLLIRPRDFDPKKKYPVVLYVYGGPGSQLTADRWGAPVHHTYRYFADLGMAVFLVDNRGTWGRGHAFETAVHRRLGELEVADQLAAVRWLNGHAWVDSDRIAVYGGSYGGYMSLLCMLKAPDVFKAGIAYAPVADWRLYDTIYTERYMDTPEDNAEGYEASAPLTWTDKLEGPLLLVHGSMDNNVHLQNTLQLVGKLGAADKTFELMIYPQTRHGVRLSSFALHFHRLKVDFLTRNLLENSGE